jgi:superfamily II DNA or RNA helicase
MLRAAPASMSPSQRTALAQHAGRLHRLHDAQREVIIYDYVDMSVPVLARMAAKRRVGYQTIGYRFLGTGDFRSVGRIRGIASKSLFSRTFEVSFGFQELSDFLRAHHLIARKHDRPKP